MGTLGERHAGPARGCPACYFRTAVWLTLLFIASRVVILVLLIGRITDLGTQMEYAVKMVAGQVPFRDFFPEYPPLVFAYTGIPALLDPSLDWYFPIFRVLTCAVDCGIWFMLLCGFVSPVAHDGSDRRPITTGQLLLYILGTTALGALIYDRIDLVLGAILLGAMLALYRGRETTFKLMIGTGIAFKLIPVVLVPMILAREWLRCRVSPVARDGIENCASTVRRPATTGMLWTCLLLALPTLLSFGAVAAMGGYRLDRLLAFHAERPIQLESGPAAAEMILMMFGAEGHVRASYGSLNLVSTYGDWPAAIAAVLLAVTCLGSAAMVLRRRMNVQAFALSLAAILSAAMVFSKVLSPQYFLFLLPVLAMLPVPRERAAAIANWLLIAVIFALTGLIFPWWYDDLAALKPGAEFMLIARNELLLVLAISLAWRAWKRSEPLGKLGVLTSSATVVGVA